MNCRALLIILVLLGIVSGKAMPPEKVVESHVATLEHFIDRINGEDLYPFVPDKEENKVRITRFSLFDMDLLSDNSTRDSVLNIQKAFVDSIENSGVKFAISDSNNWIEAYCVFSYDGRDIPLILSMTLEEYKPDYWRWAVFDVSDPEGRLLNFNEKIPPINSLEHEFDFMHLDKYFSDFCKDISGVRSSSCNVDRLSYFFGVASTGRLKFKDCGRVVFINRQLPGWEFRAEQINRIETSNSGWLIKSLRKIN